MNQRRRGKERGGQKGATLVEYAVLLALIAAAVFVVIGSVGFQLQQSWAGFNQAFVNAGIGGGSGDQDGSQGNNSGGNSDKNPGKGQGKGQGDIPPGQEKKLQVP